jgi:regulator of ribonuclease activity A
MTTSAAIKFATCDLCDANRSNTSGSFRVLPPVFGDFGGVSKFCGPIVTVRCFEDNGLAKAAVNGSGMVETPNGPAAGILVIDGGGSLRRALLGGNLGASAVKNGWAGVLIDGCVRDVAELAGLEIGIRALAAIPMPPDKHGTGERDIAVQIQGVWVYPDDWLYADEDGIVVMPPPLNA